MNGVEFHSVSNRNYQLKKPSHNKHLDELVDIPYPDVPPAVTNKHTVQEQIEEMRLWFKAFKDQDHSQRDYRPYFRANLCYLEGGWTLLGRTVNEPWNSTKHLTEANQWFNYLDMARFQSYSGIRSQMENFQYLPTTLYNVTEGIPHFAQFHVTTKCHPISKDVSTNYFKLQDDLAPRMSHNVKWDTLSMSALARFKLNEFGTDRSTKYTLLDEIMGEIPGKDNYGVNITDNSFGLMHYDISKSGYVPLNVGHYHRWYKLSENGAMGVQINHRGFKDENLWVAMTTQPNIMPMDTHRCIRGTCYWETFRVTYALPIEIVYTSPLLKWNPYGITHHGDDHSEVIKNHRNGGVNAAHAFNGSSTDRFYRTPIDFFKETAGLLRAAKGVLDKDGQLRKMYSSGTKMITPDIVGVGHVRLRYPIIPVHAEGSTIGEELGALKEMVMKMSSYQYLYEDPPTDQSTNTQPDHDVTFHVADTYKNPPGLHGHDFTLTADEHRQLLNGTEIHVVTSYNLGHNHELIIWYRHSPPDYFIKRCDGLTACWDLHGFRLTKLP